jgi:hypothetical protein
VSRFQAPRRHLAGWSRPGCPHRTSEGTCRPR